jgi:hypothetical protein
MRLGLGYFITTSPVVCVAYTQAARFTGFVPFAGMTTAACAARASAARKKAYPLQHITVHAKMLTVEINTIHLDAIWMVFP